MLNKEKNSYFALIDIGRFLAAISVLSFHYFSLTAKDLEYGIVRIFIENGFLGVQLFFMISGFVIFFSLQGDIKKFALGRFLRIYPLFWLCCTVTYLVTIFFASSHVSFPVYLLNFFILNSGKTAYMVDGSYWTLTHELFFYSYVGIFVYLFGKKRIELFFYIWLFILSVAILFELQNFLLFKVLLIRSGHYFIFGGLLALQYSTWKESTLYEKVRRAVGMSLAVCSSLHLSTVLQNTEGVITNYFGMYDSVQKYILIFLYILIIILVVFSKYLRNTSVIYISQTLGGITYPLYLLHQVIGATILGLFGVYGYFNGTSLLFVMTLCVISYYIYGYEKKIRSNMQKKINAEVKV